jgi:hypothetical protein
MTREEKTREIVESMTNYVNTMSLDNEMFNSAMVRQHRTLQQSFTRLCVGWLEFVGSEEYGRMTDGRNEASHKFGKKFLDLFEKFRADEKEKERVTREAYYRSEVAEPYYTEFYVPEGGKLAGTIPCI